MSAGHGIVAGVGFTIEFVRTWISVGAEVDSIINGALGALGALIAKELYELVKKKLKQRKQNKIQNGIQGKE